MTQSLSCFEIHALEFARAAPADFLKSVWRYALNVVFR